MLIAGRRNRFICHGRTIENSPEKPIKRNIGQSALHPLPLLSWSPAVPNQPPDFDASLEKMRESAPGVGQAADVITLIAFMALMIQIIVGLIRSDH